MTLEEVERFWEWVRREAYNTRGWSIRGVERHAGFRYGRINNAINQQREPTLEMFQGIAKAFDLSLVEVQRAAGILPPVSEARRQEFEYAAEQLASLPDGPIREEAMAAINAIAENARKRAQALEEKKIEEEKEET